MADDLTFTTVVLRFRDLVTTANETIRLHAEIIARAGGVWWGWWSKGTEKVPDEPFRKIKAAAVGPGGLEIFLLDSGTSKVYRARCVDLRWQPTHELMASPDPGQTPPYYRGRPYLAWLRLTQIEEVPADSLKEFSYVRIDTFFDSGTSRYTPFYGKRIYSNDELRQQERTIWFVRPATEQDPTHYISLLDNRKLTPEHFTKEFLAHPSRTILWVSDPHLSEIERTHGFPLETNAAQSSLGQAIENACKEVAGVPQVGGVWISGDLTWRADPAEFGLARRFVTKLQSWANLDNYHYAVCPGNHDLRFSADPSTKESPVTVAADEAAVAYADFYQSLFYIRPNEFLCSGRRYLLDGAIPVEVAFLNSSLLQQAAGSFQGHGFVGERQLRHVAAQMGWEVVRDDRPIRVLVLHHHMLPVTFRELPINGRMYSVALDAEAIMRWAVQCRVDLILHGHMHQPFLSKVTRHQLLTDESSVHTVAVVGAGSAGVHQSHLGEVARNTFATLNFHGREITVSTYSVHSVNPSELVWSVKIPLERKRP